MYKVENTLYQNPTNCIYHRYCDICKKVEFIYSYDKNNKLKNSNVNKWIEITDIKLKTRLLGMEGIKNV